MPQPFDVRAFANAWNTQSVDRILDFYADDAEMIVAPDNEPYRGKEGIRENIAEVFGGIEDLNGDVEWSVQDGNRVSLLVHMTGRHAGELVVSDDVRVPATGRDIGVMMGIFLELNEQGKIRREIDLADNLGILQQAGALQQLTAGGGAQSSGTAGAQRPARSR